MKVAVVYLAEYPPHKGASGGDRRVRDIARGIASQGHDVYMAVPRRDSGQVSARIDGLKVTYLGKTGRGFIGKVKNRLSFWSKLHEFALSEKADWVLFYMATADAFAAMVSMRRSGLKIAAEFSDLRSSGFARNNIFGLLNWSKFKLDEALIPKVTDLNIAISRYLLAHVQARAPKTASMQLPVLVDSSLFKVNDAAGEQAREKWVVGDDDILFAYVGGLWKSEGVGGLVEAFAQVVERQPKARLIIAGRLTKSPRHDDIAGMVEELGLQDSVITPGWVSTEDVITIYSRADVLVLPQINDQFAIAALPTKSAEYAMMGKPIIATEVGDIPLYFRDGEDALLVKSENAGALAAAMERLIEDPDLRRRLAAASRKVADTHFDYREAGKRIVAAMEAAKR